MPNNRPLESTVKLKGNRVVLYFRNKTIATGFTLRRDKKYPLQFSNGRLTSGWHRDNYKEANQQIQEKKNKIDQLIIDANRKGIKDIKSYLSAYFQEEDENLKRILATRQTKIHEAFESYILTVKSKSKKIKSESSTQRYYSELARLKDFSKSDTLGDIDSAWIEKFCEYLSTPKEKTYEIEDKKLERKYTATKTLSQANSTIIRFLKDLKAFFKILSTSSDLQLPINETQDLIEDLNNARTKKDEVIALTREQWDEFKNFQPNPNKRWEIDTYNAFKFCVMTGLRWSDFIRLEDTFVDSNNVIKMSTQKTNTYFEVPMKPAAVQIFEQYGRSFKGKFSVNQQQNKNLRKILKKIPLFCQESEKTTWRLNRKETKRIKLFEKITFHSSRRTFVSFCVQHACTLDQIQKYTGWTDLRTLMKYMNVFGKKSTENDLPNF